MADSYPKHEIPIKIVAALVALSPLIVLRRIVHYFANKELERQKHEKDATEQ